MPVGWRCSCVFGGCARGYIYPKAERAVRDPLRRRVRLVQQHTANLVAVQNLFARR
jgi:transposase